MYCGGPLDSNLTRIHTRTSSSPLPLLLTVLGKALEAVAYLRAAHQEQRWLEARVLAEVRGHPEDLLGQLAVCIYVCGWVDSGQCV